MTIKQAPSGSWFIRKTINGKQMYINFEHKPTKHEIEDRIQQLKNESAPNVHGTFKECAEKYIEDKKAVISPSTVVSYKSIIKNLSPTFLALKMAQITQVDVQVEISSYTKDRSPKTVRNASGFISAVIKYYRPTLQLTSKLPQKEKKTLYIPTEDEVRTVIKEVAGTEYELCTLLGIMGLRKSEALALTSADLDGNIITINKALVVNEKKQYVIKETKNTDSTRSIWIPDNIRDLLLKQGTVYDGFPGNVLRNLHRIQDKYGMKRFRLHDLRHYYVSYAHSLGIPDAAIAETVGHKNTNTTRAIYLHAMKDQQQSCQQQVADKIFK